MGDSMTEKLNWSTAIEAVEGNEKLLVELIELFLSDYSVQLDGICKACEENDALALHRSVHQLNGSLKYFGKTEAGAISLRLEQLAKQRSLSESHLLSEHLRTAIEQMIPSVREFASSIATDP